MPSITSIKNKLARDNPTLTFVAGEAFSWNPTTRTVSFTPGAEHEHELLLHESAHALLDHRGYSRDIELLRMEREAWDYATTTLSPRLQVAIDPEVAQDSLDTYRTWLHKRSTCPACGLNGVQDSRTTYRCIHCQERWSVNEARTCQLKRTRLKPKTTSS